MPEAAGKKFPYTAKGFAQARRAKRNLASKPVGGGRGTGRRTGAGLRPTRISARPKGTQTPAATMPSDVNPNLPTWFDANEGSTVVERKPKRKPGYNIANNLGETPDVGY